MKRIAVVRIRGEVNVGRTLAQTMKMLRLYKKHNCVILSDTQSNVGMVNKIKDHVTWGEIDEPTLKLLLEKRARVPGNKLLNNEYLHSHSKTDIESFAKDIFAGKKELKDVPGLKLFFKLKPPVHGFEPGGIKKPYSLGGALGYRKENINNLLKRMI